MRKLLVPLLALLALLFASPVCADSSGSDRLTFDGYDPVANPAIGRRLAWSAPSIAGTTFTAVGTSSGTVNGTTASLVDATGNYVTFTTAATTGSLAGIGSGSMCRCELQLAPVWKIKFKTGSDLTNMRIWAGVSGGSTLSTATPGNGGSVLLRYDPAVDTTAFFRLWANNVGVNNSAPITPIAVTANTAYEVIVDGRTSGQVSVYVNGVFAGAASGSSCPTSTTLLDAQMLVYTNENVAKSISDAYAHLTYK